MDKAKSFARDNWFNILTIVVMVGSIVFNKMEKVERSSERLDKIESVLERLTDKFQEHLLSSEGKIVELNAVKEQMNKVEIKINGIENKLWQK